MEKIFILLCLTGSTCSTKAEVTAYPTEIECQRAASKAKMEQGVFTTVRASCQSVDALLKETN